MIESNSAYVHAINQIDAVIKEKITNIENEVSMKDEFKVGTLECQSVTHGLWNINFYLYLHGSCV